MMMSHSTTSGRTSATRSMASRPLPTVTTSKSSSENVSSMTFWIVMLSSASRIFLPIESALRAESVRGVKIERHHPYVKERSAVAADGMNPGNRQSGERSGIHSRGASGAPRGCDQHPLVQRGLYQADDVLRRRAGQEHLGHAEVLQDRDVLGRNDPAPEDLDRAHALLPQQLQDAAADRQVRAGEDREADDVRVLLRGRGHDLLGRLPQAGI